MSLSSQEKLAVMKRYELLRASAIVPTEAISGVFLIAAVQYFDASSLSKGLIAASAMFGLVLAPLLTSFFAARSLNPSLLIARIYLVCAVGMLVCAFAWNVHILLLGAFLSVCLNSAMVPLFTGLWRQNVDSDIRGRIFGYVLFRAIAAKLVFALLISWWMGDEPGRYRAVALLGSGLFLVGAYAVRHIPSKPIVVTSKNPLARLGLLAKNPFFGYISLAWLFLGLGNLSQLPLRTELVGSGQYGPAYSAMWILILLEVIPTFLRLITIPAWGRVFDHVNFMKLRIAINLIFALGIALFFSGVFELQVIAAVLSGIGMGGGTIAWNLWLTKFVPANQTEDYMSVHAFLTGLRGSCAPLIAFVLSEHYHPYEIVFVSFCLVILSSALFIPLLEKGKKENLVHA